MQLSPRSLPSSEEPRMVSFQSWFLCSPRSEAFLCLTCPRVMLMASPPLRTSLSIFVESCLPFTHASYKHLQSSFASLPLLPSLPHPDLTLFFVGELIFFNKNCGNDSPSQLSNLATGLDCPHLTLETCLLRLPSDSPCLKKPLLVSLGSHPLFSVHPQNCFHEHYCLYLPGCLTCTSNSGHLLLLLPLLFFSCDV